ncbi:ribbon-helix-helix protein, CopG family [Maridesulfovibrio sp.]|uniref:CopG family ribbon-helix-helix protein n=1 Tax=Maridesulfovibrio sp. TaxID=2795000 RepID=UPI0029CA2C29|nr:ribbon-helix-helix protein, CopG family [Maridesulfovibrio sp.]
MPSLVSTRFDDATLERLDEAAGVLGNTRSGVIKDAVKHYLEYITWYSAEVQKGIDAADAGKVVSHEKLGDKLREFGVELD